MTTNIHPVANEEKPLEKSMLTSPSESYLEKLSPASASIHSNTPNAEDTVAKNDDSTNVSNDETQYPPNITKVAVGVGLALAVFLVLKRCPEVC
jgi:hypothetical protein